MTLIQSILSALPTNFMSIFKMPIGVAEDIEKIMRNFFWEGFESSKSRSAMAWEVCCRPKVKGGLGLGGLKKKNQALLAKWLWRFPLENGALWHNVITAIYGFQPNGWDPGSARTLRSPWKSIFSVQEEFYKRCKWVVRDGSKIWFWEDIWCREKSL